MKINLILFLLILAIEPLSAQKFIGAKSFNGDGYANERTYIGGEEKFVDKITGSSVTKVNVITEKTFTRYFIVDSIFWYDTVYVDNYKPGYEPVYDYLDDSVMVFMQQKIADDYDASSLVKEKVYEHLIFVDSLKANKVLSFSQKEQKSLKEENVIAYFIYDSITWKDIRELPLRPFVKQVIDTLGLSTHEYLEEISYPMTYNEILDSINLYRNYAIDSLTARAFDPFQYLTELVRLQFMFPYYKANIQKAYIREAILNQMIKMMSERINELRRFTSYDLTRESAFTNLIAYKNVNGFNPRCVNLDTIPYYYTDEYDSVKVKMVPRNPDGAVNIQFNQLQLSSLKAAAKNMAYEMDKWYKANWQRIYGRKELDPGEFEPIKEK